MDVDPVLRHFAARKETARERFGQFVMAGIKHGHRGESYQTDEGGILGSEEFVDATIHRIGETRGTGKRNNRMLTEAPPDFDASALLMAVEQSCGIAKGRFCGPGKSSELINAKEALILVGRKAGASLKSLSDLTGISSSAVSRRHDAARRRMTEDGEMIKLTKKIARLYLRPS